MYSSKMSKKALLLSKAVVAVSLDSEPNAIYTHTKISLLSKLVLAEEFTILL